MEVPSTDVFRIEMRKKEKQNLNTADCTDVSENEAVTADSRTNLDAPSLSDDKAVNEASQSPASSLGESLEQAKQNFANREVTAPKRRHKWVRVAFFVVVLLLTFYLMYQLAENTTNGDDKTLAEILANLNVKYLVIALAIWLTMMLLDALKYFIIIHSVTKKFMFGTSVKTGLWGKYYDNITPFSSGGQPFQIHYLFKRGISGGESTAIICIKFCFNVLMWLLICFCLMIFNRSALTKYVADETQRNLFSVLGWVGFGINCFLPLAIIAFAVFPKMTEALTKHILNIGHKLHIVKDKDTVIGKAKRGVNDFRSSFVLMAHKPLHLILLLLCCVCESFLGMTLPYFVVLAMAGDAVVPSFELMFAIMTMYVFVTMSVTAIPTPGNSGAIESAFVLILTTVAEGVLFWSVLTWRFLSYYTYIIIGMCVFIADFIKKSRKRN